MATTDIKEKNYFIVLWAMIAIYVGVFFTSSMIRFLGFDFRDMDLAVYDQIIWNILRGQYHNSILGIHFLGHHAHFLAFPLAVIYYFFPHPLTLLFVQTLVLGVAAYPLYLLARRYLNHLWALSIAALYLLYPPLGCTNAYEFHFTPFATLSLMYACYFFFEGRYLAFMISMLLTLLCQENMPLVVFAFGIYAVVQKKPPQWWLPLMVVSVLYFIICIKILIPNLDQNRIQFISIYDHFGTSYGQILRTMVMHPVYTLQYMFLAQRKVWLFKLFSPLLFLSFVSPVHLIPAVPLFLQHLLTNRFQENDINFHYAAEIIPFIFVSFVFGIKKLLNSGLFKQMSLYVMIVIFGATLISYKNFGPHIYLKTKVLDDRVRVYQQMADRVSPDSALVATFKFLSHASHRKNLYSFHSLYTGRYTLSDLPFKKPDHVDEALIDFNDTLTFGSFYKLNSYRNIVGMMRYYHLRPMAARDNVVYFKRNGSPSMELYRTSNTAPPGLADKTPIFKHKGIELKEIQTAQRGDTLFLDMTWTARSITSKDINVYVEFINHRGEIIRRTLTDVCYRFLPTQAWKAGQWVVDHKFLTIPLALRGSPFLINVGFWDQATKHTLGASIPVEVIK